VKRKKLIGMLLFVVFAILIISAFYLYKSTKGYKYNPYTIQVSDRDYEIVLETESAAQEERKESAAEEINQEEAVTENTTPQMIYQYGSYEELERVFYETFRYQMLWALDKGQDIASEAYVISQEEYARLISQEDTIITWAKSKSQSLIGDGKTEEEAEEILYKYITDLGEEMREEEREILSKCGSLAHLLRALIEQVKYTSEGISDFTSGTEKNDCQIALSKQAVWLIVIRSDGSSYHYDPAFGTDDPDAWKMLNVDEITRTDGYHAEFVILH